MFSINKSGPHNGGIANQHALNDVQANIDNDGNEYRHLRKGTEHVMNGSYDTPNVWRTLAVLPILANFLP
jgi:hypothetical protein